MPPGAAAHMPPGGRQAVCRGLQREAVADAKGRRGGEALGGVRLVEGDGVVLIAEREARRGAHPADEGLGLGLGLGLG